MADTAVIPAWVVPTAQAVADCRGIASAGAGRRDRSVYAEVSAALAWVLDDQTTQDQVEKWMIANSGGPIGDTLAWLLGMASIPPLRLPRRNPDGSLMTPDQLYDEYIAGKTGLPEQRLEARNRARKDAALYQQLAAYAHR